MLRSHHAGSAGRAQSGHPRSGFERTAAKNLRRLEPAPAPRTHRVEAAPHALSVGLPVYSRAGREPGASFDWRSGRACARKFASLRAQRRGTGYAADCGCGDVSGAARALRWNPRRASARTTAGDLRRNPTVKRIASPGEVQVTEAHAIAVQREPAVSMQ